MVSGFRSALVILLTAGSLINVAGGAASKNLLDRREKSIVVAGPDVWTPTRDA